MGHVKGEVEEDASKWVALFDTIQQLEECGWAMERLDVGFGGFQVVEKEELELFWNRKTIAGKLEEPPLGQIEGFIYVVEKDVEGGLGRVAVFHLVEDVVDGKVCGAPIDVGLLAGVKETMLVEDVFEPGS